MMGFVIDDRKVEEKWKFCARTPFPNLCLSTSNFLEVSVIHQKTPLWHIYDVISYH